MAATVSEFRGKLRRICIGCNSMATKSSGIVARMVMFMVVKHLVVSRFLGFDGQGPERRKAKRQRRERRKAKRQKSGKANKDRIPLSFPAKAGIKSGDDEVLKPERAA